MRGNELIPLEEIKILLLSAVLAIFGGFAKLFMSSKRLTVHQFLSCCIVSGFTGVMASYLVRYMNLPHFLQSFLIGMAGFAGPAALSAFTCIYEKKLGIRANGNNLGKRN
ncbi:phage holin family protein [Desulfoferrobacter suflitae]|uniref:phage holin family protein n=1 Tax=Desulfoferrobacter suflitae TaxID=2865782 RepID=UPI002164D68C|nr:phage holin family protein [Desulfoferrobacter suflitae]MCK8604411.1 phage holin family protein [Desulfoferrobacter suflitae]